MWALPLVDCCLARSVHHPLSAVLSVPSVLTPSCACAASFAAISFGGPSPSLPVALGGIPKLARASDPSLSEPGGADCCRLCPRARAGAHAGVHKGTHAGAAATWLASESVSLVASPAAALAACSSDGCESGMLGGGGAGMPPISAMLRLSSIVSSSPSASSTFSGLDSGPPSTLTMTSLMRSPASAADEAGRSAHMRFC